MDLRDAAQVISGKSTARDPNSNDLTVRVGVVTAVGAGTVSIKLGGDSTVIPNVRYLASYVPTVNDVVQVVVNGTALLIIGSVAPAGDTPATVRAAIAGTWLTQSAPAVFTSPGTLTSFAVNSAIYFILGHTLDYYYDVTVTNIGTATAASALYVPLPQNSAYVFYGQGRETAVNGSELTWEASGPNVMINRTYANATILANGMRFVGSGRYAI